MIVTEEQASGMLCPRKMGPAIAVNAKSWAVRREHGACCDASCCMAWREINNDTVPVGYCGLAGDVK